LKADWFDFVGILSYGIVSKDSIPEAYQLVDEIFDFLLATILSSYPKMASGGSHRLEKVATSESSVLFNGHDFVSLKSLYALCNRSGIINWCVVYGSEMSQEGFLIFIGAIRTPLDLGPNPFRKMMGHHSRIESVAWVKTLGAKKVSLLLPQILQKVSGGV